MAEAGRTVAAVVYVPSGGHPATAIIAAASGIVGRPDGTGSTEIYFEGAIYDQVNLSSLADRVASAYDRMTTGYPTAARMTVPREALVAVGTFAPADGRIELTGPDSEGRVAAWLADGDRPLDPTELLCSRGWRP